MDDLSSFELVGAQALQSSEQMELLDVVDSLRAHGVGEITALPQLIVCGDQSSGKSSVLEAISGIPFPSREGLVTRFATEVILRRTRHPSITVSIAPANGRTKEDQARLRQFHETLTTQDGFAALFERAENEIGLSDSGQAFSRDTLQVEVCGPLQPQLTLVDLPGLIHSATRSQSAEDVRLVTDLVGEYLQNPRSIILAVVTANNDASNQVILKRARDVDPNGKRTLGIITKPDLLAENSDGQRKALSLARNEEVSFDLGWHVVRNLDTSAKNTITATRDEIEAAYFKASSFGDLSPTTTGIAALRIRLSKVLFDQIRTELPRLIKDIDTQILQCSGELDKLGPGRPDLVEQRRFLRGLSQNFHDICKDAIKGDYDDLFFQADHDPKRCLWASIVNSHMQFAEALHTYGSSWKIVDEASGVLHERTRKKAIKEACKILKRSRGRELPGLSNPRLVGDLFRDYSRPWENIAKNHIKSIWTMIKSFIDLVLHYLADDDVTKKLLQILFNPIMEQCLAVANKSLDTLLQVYKEPPFTTNRRFMDNVEKMQEQNSKEQTQARNVDLDMVAAEKSLDHMTGYYEVALPLFQDNVPNIAIQGPLVRAIPMMFYPEIVNEMSDENVALIAKESEKTMGDREELVQKLKILKDGIRICNQHSIWSLTCAIESNGQDDGVNHINDDDSSDDGDDSDETDGEARSRPVSSTQQDHPSMQSAAATPSSFAGFGEPNSVSGLKHDAKPARRPRDTNTRPFTGYGLFGTISTDTVESSAKATPHLFGRGSTSGSKVDSAPSFGSGTSAPRGSAFGSTPAFGSGITATAPGASAFGSTLSFGSGPTTPGSLFSPVHQTAFKPSDL